MAARVITLGVPCEITSTKIVEDFMDVIAPQLHLPNVEKTLRELKNVLNEAFTNVFRHSGHPEDLPVEIAFEMHSSTLVIRVRYSGQGFPVNGIWPPYPEHLLGSQHILRATINGELVACITDPVSVEILFHHKSSEVKARKGLISGSRPGGMGLAIIAQLTNKVSFQHLSEGKNELRMTRKLTASNVKSEQD